MPGKSITLDLPEDLYERVRHVAEQSQRPVERVLVESIHLLFVTPSTPTDLEAKIVALPGYSDAELWAVVEQRLAWSQSQRLHALSAKNKLVKLTEDEQSEFEHLLTLNDHAMLLRSEALLLLKNRGHEIAAYLEHGA